MDKRLYEKIIDGRISDPLELDEQDRLRLKQEPQAMLALQENQALAELAGLVPPEPDREAALANAFSTTESPQYDSSARRGIWPPVRRGWPLRAVAVAALALVIALTFNFAPLSPGGGGTGLPGLAPAQPAWAAKPGLLMECGTGTSDEDLAREIAESVDARLRETLAGHYADLQEYHVAVARQRSDLRDHQLYLEQLHLTDDTAEDQAETRLKLEELRKLLASHIEQLEETEIGREALLQLADQHLAQLDLQLAELNAELAGLAEGEVSYLSRDISRDDGGNYIITLALPGLSIEQNMLRDRLGELQEINDLRLENAVFFVRGTSGNADDKEKTTRHWEWHSVVPGAENTVFNHRIAFDTPEPEVVKAEIRRVLSFSDGSGNIEVELEGRNGHSAVVLQREGKLLEKLEGRTLGDGIVWYSLPDAEQTFQVYLNKSIDAAELHGELSEVVQHSIQLGRDLKVQTIDEIMELHGGLELGLPDGLDGDWPGGDRVLEVSVTSPGELPVLELDGKILAVLGEATAGRRIEVVTESDGESKLIRVLVDGEEVRWLHITGEDIEVVVARSDEQDPAE